MIFRILLVALLPCALGLEANHAQKPVSRQPRDIHIIPRSWWQNAIFSVSLQPHKKPLLTLPLSAFCPEHRGVDLWPGGIMDPGPRRFRRHNSWVPSQRREVHRVGLRPGEGPYPFPRVLVAEPDVRRRHDAVRGVAVQLPAVVEAGEPGGLPAGGPRRERRTLRGPGEHQPGRLNQPEQTFSKPCILRVNKILYFFG